MKRSGKMRSAVAALTVIGSFAMRMSSADAVPLPRWTAAEKQRGYVVFRRHTVEPIDCRLLMPPSFIPERAAILRNRVGCDVAQGEGESLVVGIHALTEGVKNVRLDAECDLELRVNRGVDAQVRKMFLEYRYQDGDGDIISSWIHGAFLDESNVIASVRKGSSDIFWLTVLTKPDTTPGIHRGKIRISSDYVGAAAKTVTELDLEVRVRPFVLQRARITYWPFFHVQGGGGRHALPVFAHTDEWLRRLYRDMAEHSSNSVTYYGYPGPSIDLTKMPPPDSPYLTKLMPMGKEVGLLTPDVPCISFITNLGPLESEGGPSIEHKNRAMDWLEGEFRKRGLPELITYTWDEPGYPARGDSARHAAFRKQHEEMRKVRVRLGTAMAADAAYGYSDVLDVWMVYAGQITPEMCIEAERLGAEVWTYSCHLHTHQPLNERYYAGLYMWVYGLKGHTTWHHYAQSNYKSIWMRKGDERPMTTVGWETRRDGIDDYRYLQMLEDAIAASPDSREAAEAAKWLASLRRRLLGTDPHLAEPGMPLGLEEYDRIKSKAADYIERLGPVVAEEPDPGLALAKKWPRGLKDEGKLFRSESVRKCMDGLNDADYHVRRAAAWALYEKGAAAAPAARLLAAQLKDAEVRMPALRALEAIGPEAYAVVPEIRKLLLHRDAYIRLGATYALGGIAGAAPWLAQDEAEPAKRLSPAQVKTVAEALRLPFADDKHWVARPAACALARMGAAAEPALPEAIELLNRPYNLYTWGDPGMVRRVIAAIGPEAAPAVPALLRIVKDKKGDAPTEIKALAAIGPAAEEAVPVLDKCAADEANKQRGVACYALVCVRGEAADLTNMVDSLKGPEGGRGELARYLDTLGAKAAAAADEARAMLKLDDLDKETREQLQSFLQKVEHGEAPAVLMP